MESLTTHTSRKKLHLWGKILLHFLVFFTTGFIAPFVPWETAAHILSNHYSIYNGSLHFFAESEAQNTLGMVSKDGVLPTNNLKQQNSSDLVIVITTTRPKDKFHLATLTRLGHSLANVSASLLWLVVEARNGSSLTSELLRGTKIMYRHLTYKDNFTDPKSEIDYQRNIALRHIERHKMAGIVHFADSSIIYDLKFFEEIRKIKSFGAWPVAMVGLNRRKVIVEGPVCEDSKIVGWFSKDISSRAIQWVSTMQDFETNPPKINIFGFGFDSSILWDLNRLSRTESTTNTTEGFIKFVLGEAAKEDENNLKGIPSDCSKIMLWQLNIPKSFVYPTLPKPNL